MSSSTRHREEEVINNRRRNKSTSLSDGYDEVETVDGEQEASFYLNDKEEILENTNLSNDNIGHSKKDMVVYISTQLTKGLLTGNHTITSLENTAKDMVRYAMAMLDEIDKQLKENNHG